MARTEFTFPSADGKTAIHAAAWTPAGTPLAILQLSHGVAEYILRYDSFARYLSDQGFAVVGHDHLGHGDSVAVGAPRLYFGPRGSWDWVVQDLYTCRSLIGKRFPGLPCFLLGHSMGSFLARTYLIRYPGISAGAILMGTGQMSSGLIASGRAAAALEVRRIGADRPSPRLEHLIFGAYNKHFAPNRTPCDWLSVSRENIEAYLQDPLCGGTPTAGLFQEMLDGLQFISKPENLRKMNLNTPILFTSGAKDPVGEDGRGLRRAFRSFQRAGVRRVSMHLYPNLRHEILYEDCRQVVYEDLCQWMKGCLA